MFAEMIDPQPQADKVEAAAAPQVEEAQASAEDAQANPDAEAQAEDDPVVTIKVDGKDIEVPLSELKKGYQKDAAANQRFEQAAELRKTAEAETQRAQAERQAYAQKLQGIHLQLQSAFQQQQQIDWDSLKANDPVEFVNQVRLAQDRQALLQRTTAELQHIDAINQAEQAKSYQNHLTAQQKDLLDKLPEWKDEGKAKAEKAALRDYLLSQGFDEQSVSGVSDAKAVVMARKAMLYDQMMSKASLAAKQVSKLPTKVERSGTGNNPGIDRRSSAYQNLQKKGTVEAAAAVFAGLI